MSSEKVIPERYEEWQKLTPWIDGDPRPEVGSLWVVVIKVEEGTCSQVGTVLRFITDDGSLCPQFSTIDDNQDDRFPYLTQMAPLPTEPAATEPDHAEYVERDGKKYPWVEVRDGDGHEWLKRVLLTEVAGVFVTVQSGDEDDFQSGGPFETLSYRQMRPIPRKKYRPYETLEECKHLIGETLVEKGVAHYVDGVSFEASKNASGVFVFLNSCYKHTAEHILAHYTHNGQPCGVEV
jgi:hypothetical protein